MSWKNRLDTAIIAGVFTAEDKELAGDWGTCAVGENYTAKDFQPCVSWVGRPVGGLYIPDLPDREDDLGLEFMDAVKDDKVMEAYKVFDQLQQIYKEKNREERVADPERQADPGHLGVREVGVLAGAGHPHRD